MTFSAAQTLALRTGCALLGATVLLTAHSGLAQPRGRNLPAPPPPLTAPDPWTAADAGPDTVYDNDPSNWRQSQDDQARRCNLGRLVGGLIGGGVGYGSSRQDGRAWAVPLGVLLGSQVGCNVGAGRGPVPW
ncbi:MAG: hypothetical protein ACK6BG_08460 [Cyanobacteriota bacterium]